MPRLPIAGFGSRCAAPERAVSMAAGGVRRTPSGAVHRRRLAAVAPAGTGSPRRAAESRVSPGQHMGENVDPHARLPPSGGTGRRVAFCPGPRPLRSMPPGPDRSSADDVGQAPPVGDVDLRGASLLDAALLRPLWDAPFLADWLETQGVVALAPGCALRCAQILNTFTSRRALRGSTATESRSVSEDLDKVPLPSSRSPPLLMEARLNRSSARWLASGCRRSFSGSRPGARSAKPP